MGVSQYFFYLLFQTARLRDLRSDETMKSLGLNVARWRALAVIRRIENCTMSSLARLSGIERTTLTRSVDHLVEEGLVHRWTPPQDRRQVNLGLTEKGEAIYLQAVQVLIDNNGGALEGIDENRLREVTRTLQQVLVTLTPDRRAADEMLAFGNSRPGDN